MSDDQRGATNLPESGAEVAIWSGVAVNQTFICRGLSAPGAQGRFIHFTQAGEWWDILPGTKNHGFQVKDVQLRSTTGSAITVDWELD
jgi:hypothetical protein